ncbi:MAG: hypothetical protein V3S14_12830 [Anaerolineae bacterium]
MSEAVVEGCRRHGLALPALTIEPGRSIVAPAAVALYRVGARTYVSVDGSMADNVRPALYGARYTALVVNKAHQLNLIQRRETFHNLMVRDLPLPG